MAIKKVYSEVKSAEHNGPKTISTRWISTLMETPERMVPKACFVIRGFEEPEKEQLEKDSPTSLKRFLVTHLLDLTSSHNDLLSVIQTKGNASGFGTPFFSPVYITVTHLH